MPINLTQRLQAAINKIQRQYPDALLALNLGAQEHELSELEELIAAPLPEDVKQIYRQCNGQQEDGANLLDGEEWLSLERIAEEWTRWKNQYDARQFVTAEGVPRLGLPVDDGIRSDWWSPWWIPFSCDGAGNHLCVDLNPSASGRYGQVIRVWHDDAERRLEATSFTEWLEGYVEGLEESDYVYAEEYDAIVDADELYAEEDDEAWLVQQERQARWQQAHDAMVQDLASSLGQSAQHIDEWLQALPGGDGATNGLLDAENEVLTTAELVKMVQTLAQELANHQRDGAVDDEDADDVDNMPTKQ